MDIILTDILYDMVRKGQEFRYEGNYEIMRIDYRPNQYSYADTGGFIPLDKGGSVYQIIRNTDRVYFAEIDGSIEIGGLTENIFNKLCRSQVQPFFFPDCLEHSIKFYTNIEKIKEIEWSMQGMYRFDTLEYFIQETKIRGINLAFHKYLKTDTYEQYAIDKLACMDDELAVNIADYGPQKFSVIWSDNRWEAVITPNFVIKALGRLPTYIPLHYTLKKVPRMVINNRVHVFGDIAQFEEDMTKAVLMGS